MPVNTILTGPSVESETITKRIVDAEIGDKITVSRTEITSVNGSTPGSPPSWASFIVDPQKRVNAREEVAVDLTVDPIGLRDNAVYQFQFEIDFSDTKSATKTQTYTVIVDDLTRLSERRYSRVDMDGFRILAKDIGVATDEYQILRYPPPSSGITIDGDGDNGHWQQHMNGGMEVDYEGGYLFIKEINDDNGFDAEFVQITRIDLNDGSSKGVTPTQGPRAWDIDRQNQDIYFSWPDSGEWQPPNGSGIYRRNYDGTGQTKIADKFARSDLYTDTVLDMAIDPTSDTMVLVGSEFTTEAESMVRTSISDPDNDVGPKLFYDQNTGFGGIIQAVDVDWENRLIFAVESEGSYVVQRRLGDLVEEDFWLIGGDTRSVYGIAANPEEQEVRFSVDGILYEAPYGNLSNVTQVSKGLPHFPVYDEAENANARPLWDAKSTVEWRK